MQPPPGPEITQLLSRWSEGDQAALEQLSPAVQTELRRIASAYLSRERGDHTLQPTALINEAYLRLMGGTRPSFENRAHFFGVAARLMRQILVDYARRRLAAMRNGGQRTDISREELTEAGQLEAYQSEVVLVVHDALDRLSEVDARKARIIEMQHFGGLTREEIAAAIGMSVATVKVDLQFATAWLRRELRAAGK